MDSRHWAAAIQTTRPPFLLLAIVCVLLGMASATQGFQVVSVLYTTLAFAGGLLAHIAVNSLNEYEDFKSGLDLNTQKTPFSGGSGSLPGAPEAASLALIIAIASLLLTFAIGVYFVLQWGWAIAPLGLLGMAIIVTYTRWLNKSALLCLIAPGLAFGPLMICTTHFVLTGDYSQQALYLSLVPFFLSNNLLLLNQFPDAEVDQQYGRNHLVIRHGRSAAVAVYGAFWFAAMMVLISGMLTAYLPTLAWAAVAILSLGGVIWWQLTKLSSSEKPAIPIMGLNVAITLLTPLLMAISLLVG